MDNNSNFTGVRCFQIFAVTEDTKAQPKGHFGSGTDKVGIW